MQILMTPEEVIRRYQEGEKPLDLTIEKWERIREFAEKATREGHFRTLLDAEMLLQAVAVPVPFCFEFQERGCVGCPLESACSPRKGRRFYRLVKIMKAYTLAGDVLPKEILMSEIDNFIAELKASGERDTL